MATNCYWILVTALGWGLCDPISKGREDPYPVITFVTTNHILLSCPHPKQEPCFALKKLKTPESCVIRCNHINFLETNKNAERGSVVVSRV